MLLSFPLNLIADSASVYFLNKEYDKALPILEMEAKNGSKQAMYKLGFMYENGLGTKVDQKKAIYWYKQMSKAYSYSIKMPKNDDLNNTDSFLTQVEQQINSESDHKGTAYAISKIDMNTPETRKLMSPRWENNFFGLVPFHENYILPLSVANSKYPRRSESVHPNATLTPIQEKYKEYKDIDENVRSANLHSKSIKNTMKKLDDLDSLLNKFDMDPTKIENTSFEYLFDNFIIKNEITMFAAPPSSGKSLISVALCNMFLVKNVIKNVIYFDADNGAATIKERNIHLLKQKWGKQFRYFHESSASKSQMFQIIKQLQKTDLTNIFIVFDSIKNFMIGGDRDKNKDVSKVMEILQSLRARGATVLFLHHTNKPQRDIQELTYAGSSAFAEDSGNAYILKKNDFKNTFIFKKFKERTGDLKDIAFNYNSNHTLKEVDFSEANETQEIAEISEIIVEFLETQSQKPSYTQIMQHLQKQGYSRNKSNQALQNGKGRHWQEEKLTQNNKSVYSLITPKVIEVEYRDYDNNLQKTEQIVQNPRTSDTSRTSPNLGVCRDDTIPIQPVQVNTSNAYMPLL